MGKLYRQAVWERSATRGNARLLMLFLAEFANDATGECWPGQARIAAAVGVSERTVKRLIDEAQAIGELVVTPGNGRGHTTRYRLELPAALPAPELSDELVTSFFAEKDDATMSPFPVVKGDTAMTPFEMEKGDKPGTERVTNSAGKGDKFGERVTSVTIKGDTAMSPDWEEIGKRDGEGEGEDRARERRPAVPPPPERKAIGEMANAITDVTGISARLNWPEVGPLAEELAGLGYTPAQLRAWYGAQKSAEMWHWYEQDWRGRRGDKPRLKEIRETIAGAAAQQPVDETKNRTETWLEHTLRLARGNGALNLTPGSTG